MSGIVLSISLCVILLIFLLTVASEGGYRYSVPGQQLGGGGEGGGGGEMRYEEEEDSPDEEEEEEGSESEDSEDGPHATLSG